MTHRLIVLNALVSNVEVVVVADMADDALVGNVEVVVVAGSDDYA